MSRTKAEKRQQLSSDDEDEDVEQKDDDLKLLMDEEERERFNQMSEKEREIEIFKRLEQREIMKTREQIKRKLEMAAGKGANERSRQKKKRRISADSDASDGEADGPTTKSRHKARAATSDEEEEGELDQDTSEDETLAGDGGGDSSQKKKGKGTTSAAVKSEASESVFDAEYHKPSELANKQNKKKAMTDLLNKRREKKQAEEKKKKEAQKAALDLDEIFGNDDKEDGKSMSSISSSTSSSRSSSPECNKSRSPSPAVALPISTRPDLLKAQIIRRRLARIVHAPFFAKVAIGCFVRVQIGTNEGRPTYRIAQVMDVVETAKIYEVEPGTDIRTNKGFKLKISNNEPHRVIRLEFVSNGEFTDTEFAFWLKRMQETASPMPTMDFVERKGKEVRDALGYNYTDAEINLMVKEKQRFKRQPHNFAFQKAELLKQKEEAAQDGDTERMRDLQQQINDFEEKAKKIDYQRTKSLSAVTAINQRNREHMKQIFLGTDRQHSEAMQVKDDDPFTRKSARMKMVTGGRIKQETTEEANSVTGIQQKTTVLSSSSTHAIGASALPASSSKTGGGDPGTSRRLSISSDLFSAHGIEINIDFGKMIPASSSSGFRAPPIGGINNSMLQQQQHPTSHHPLQQKPSTGSSRTLTLEEYKRKYSTRLT